MPLAPHYPLTAVKVVKAHLDVKYEKMPPKFFNFPMPCAMLMNMDELPSSPPSTQASLNVASNADAVLCANELAFVIVESAVVD